MTTKTSITKTSAAKNLAFLRAERVLHDSWVKTLNGQRQYEIRTEPGGRDRFEVAATVRGIETARFVIIGGELERCAGPFRTKVHYDDEITIIPSTIWLVCDHCHWVGKKRTWSFRRHMLSEAVNHRCPIEPATE